MKRLVIASVAVGMLAGCVIETSPQSLSESRSVPLSRIKAYSSVTNDANEIWIKRDPGRPACLEELSIDGKIAAYVDGGEKVRLYLKAGEHSVALRPVNDETLQAGAILCSAPSREYPLFVSSDTKTQYRIFVDESGHVQLSPTATN